MSVKGEATTVSTSPAAADNAGNAADIRRSSPWSKTYPPGSPTQVGRVFSALITSMCGGQSLSALVRLRCGESFQEGLTVIFVVVGSVPGRTRIVVVF